MNVIANSNIMKNNSKLNTPHSSEIEKFVLGAMMIDANALSNAMEIVTSDSFYDEKNKIVFNAIANLFNNNENADYISVAEEVKKIDKNSIVNFDYIAQIIADTPTAANIIQHTKLLHELYLKRKVIDNNNNTIKDALERKSDAFEIIENQQNFLDELLQISTTTIVTPDKQTEVFVNSYKQSLENKDEYPRTGIKKFDDMFGPFLPGQMVVIAARPSIGKTSLAVSIAKNMSNSGVRVAYISLEMTAFELLAKLFAMDNNTSSEIVTNGHYNREIEMSVERFVSKLPNSNIYIDDTPQLNEVTMLAKLKRMVKMYGIKVAFIDYLGLMDCSQKKSNRESEISHISRKIKAIAKKLQITIITLVQINRQAETGKFPTPALHNLRDSGSIEQDADVVILIDRPEFYGYDIFEDKESCVDKARLIVAKRRGGRTGMATINFKSETTEFCDYDGQNNAVDSGYEEEPF